MSQKKAKRDRKLERIKETERARQLKMAWQKDIEPVFLEKLKTFKPL